MRMCLVSLVKGLLDFSTPRYPFHLSHDCTSLDYLPMSADGHARRRGRTRHSYRSASAVPH